MSWNYRVIMHDDTEPKEVWLQVVEVYYDKNNIPDGYIKEGKSASGSSIKELRWSLNKMKEALKKPILSVKNFPNEYIEKT